MFEKKKGLIICFVVIFLLPTVYAGLAEYNSTFGAPYCNDMGDSLCISGSSLLQCAGSQPAPGPEPNQPNTIDSCVDPNSIGDCHVDESIENVTIVNLNGTDFEPGNTIMVNFTAFCYGTIDRVAVYYANDTSDVNWKRITAGNPTCTVEDTFEEFSETFVLDGTNGTHAIRVINTYDRDIASACDGRAYTDYDDVVFSVDTASIPPSTAPSVSLNNPFDDYNISVDSILFNWTALDDNDDSLLCNLTINGVVDVSAVESLNNTPTLVNVTDFLDGSYSWNVSCINDYNLTNSSETRTFFVDTTIPNLTVSSPIEGYNYTSTTINLNYTVQDSGSGINSCWYTNTTGGTEILTNCQDTTFYSYEGSKSITVYVNDTLGNEDSITINFVVDVTGPVVNLENPANGSIETASSTVTFSYNVTDSFSDISYCSLYLDGVLNETDNSITDGVSQSFEKNLGNGDYNWYVGCVDILGNFGNSSARILTVDYTPAYAPTINLISPANGSTSTNQDMTFSYNVTSVLNISSCNLTLNGVVDSTDSSITKDVTQTFGKTSMSNGVYNWSIDCIDLNDNINSSEEWIVIVSYTAPSGDEPGGDPSGGTGGTSSTSDDDNETVSNSSVSDDTDTVYLNITIPDGTNSSDQQESGNLLTGFATFADKFTEFAGSNLVRLIVFIVFFVGLLALYFWLIRKKKSKSRKKKRSKKKRGKKFK
jgi:hypothetical protein